MTKRVNYMVKDLKEDTQSWYAERTKLSAKTLEGLPRDPGGLYLTSEPFKKRRHATTEQERAMQACVRAGGTLWARANWLLVVAEFLWHRRELQAMGLETSSAKL
jgi:hypothetical protein